MKNMRKIWYITFLYRCSLKHVNYLKCYARVKRVRNSDLGELSVVAVDWQPHDVKVLMGLAVIGHLVLV